MPAKTYVVETTRPDDGRPRTLGDRFELDRRGAAQAFYWWLVDNGYATRARARHAADELLGNSSTSVPVDGVSIGAKLVER